MSRTQIANRQLLDIVSYRKTADYTLVLGDASSLIEMNLAIANSLTIPVSSSVDFAIGTTILVTQYGVGETTIVPDGGVTVNYSGASLKIASQHSFVSLLKIGADEWDVFGALEQTSSSSGLSYSEVMRIKTINI